MIEAEPQSLNIKLYEERDINCIWRDVSEVRECQKIVSEKVR